VAGDGSFDLSIDADVARHGLEQVAPGMIRIHSIDRVPDLWFDDFSRGDRKIVRTIKRI
jgi:hypothetical protein